MDICGKIMLANLKRCPGVASPAGIFPRAYCVAKADIVKWPTLPPNTGTEASATYVGDFVLAADKHWSVIDLIAEESPVTSEAQGKSYSQTSLNKATLKYPGTDKAATAFARTANAADLVYLVRDKLGNYRVIGSEAYNTLTKVGQALGGAATDDSGTTIEIEVTDIMPAPFYEGKIDTEEGDLGGDGASTEGGE